MKIALLTDGLWPYVIGGMQKHSYYLCKYLARSGVKVHLYHTRRNSTVKPGPSLYFDETEFLNIEEFLIDYPKSHSFPGHYLYESYQYSKALYMKMKSFIGEYDLLYIQGFSGWYMLEKGYKEIQLPPCILNFHGFEMFQLSSSFRNKLEQFMFRPFVLRLIGKADYIQSLGSGLTKLLTQLGIYSNKIIEQGIGIEESWINTNSISLNNKKTFTFIGRYERRKGIKELSQVLKKLLPKFDFEFNFIGPIPELKKIKSHCIIYHGLVKDQEYIKSILQKTDFLIVPSYAEGMPTVILEAMASGCAIIATDVGAISEQVSDKNGFLISPGNAVELRWALEKAVLTDEETLQNMKQHSLQLVKRQFTWDTVISKMIKEFQLVIQKNED